MELTNWYAISKALHLIGMVSWMAGIFYLVRIMVYHAEALRLDEPNRSILSKQYNLMEWKAYRVIVQPAVILTWSFGVIMLCLQPAWLSQGWMHVKLLLLVLYSSYTHYCKGHIRRLETNNSSFTSVQYRAMNEIPTLFMVGIIFLAVQKSNVNWWYFSLGIGLFSGLIFYAVYKVARLSRRK